MIDPAKTTPQAPLALRAGSKGHARAVAAKAAGKPAPDAAEDDDEDEEEEEEDGPPSSDRMGAYEASRAAAEDAHGKAADAYKAAKGTDSASALMHAEDMGDAATAAHSAAKVSSMALRGAEAPPADPAVPPAPAKPAPASARAPAVTLARAIAATAGPSLDAQTEIAARLAYADRMLAIFPGSLDASEGAARAAKQDAAEALTLRGVAARDAAEKKKRDARDAAEKKKRDARDAEKALHGELASAVRAGKYARAELFDVAEAGGVEVLTPQAWIRDMAPGARAAMIAKKQARAGAGGGAPLIPDETAVHVSAALLEYGRVRGWPAGDPRYAAMAVQLNSNGASAPQETA